MGANLNMGQDEQVRKKVLVVDDETDLRDSIYEIVSPVFDCTLAANGAEAYSLLSKKTFDVILTDADMPELNGFELIRRLHERSIETPVIVLTGRGSKELQKQSTAFNVFEYLEKPFNPDRLIELLHTCCYVDWKATRQPDISNPIAKVFYEDFDIRISREAAGIIKTLAEKNEMSVSSAIERLILKR